MEIPSAIAEVDDLWPIVRDQGECLAVHTIAFTSPCPARFTHAQGFAPCSRLVSKICSGADTCCWEETEDPAEADRTKVRGP